MSNAYSDRRARLVLCPANLRGGPASVGDYNLRVDMAGFYSTDDDHYYIDLVEATPLAFEAYTGTLPGSTAQEPFPDVSLDIFARPLAIIMDMPQPGSFNTIEQAQTRVIGYLHRDWSAPLHLLSWKFEYAQNAPFKVQPDMLMGKIVRVRFVPDCLGEDGQDIAQLVAQYYVGTKVQAYASTLVFAVSKKL